jgi:hypothetical protein
MTLLNSSSTLLEPALTNIGCAGTVSVSWQLLQRLQLKQRLRGRVMLPGDGMLLL